MPARNFGPGEPISLGALINLETNGRSTHYLMGPRAGGTEILHDKKEILVITPQSPLGEQLVGQKAGEALQLKLGNERRTAKIIAVE